MYFKYVGLLQEVYGNDDSEIARFSHTEQHLKSCNGDGLVAKQG
jgi:hypothetical protein